MKDEVLLKKRELLVLNMLTWSTGTFLEIHLKSTLKARESLKTFNLSLLSRIK